MNGAYFRVQPSPQLVPLRSLFLRLLQQAPTTGGGASPWKREGKGARAMHFYVQSLQEGEGAGRGTGARVRWAVRRFASMQLVRSGQWMLPWRAYKASCNMWPCCCYSRWGNTMLLGYVTTNIYSRIILILGLHQHRKTMLGTTRVGAGKVNCDVAWYRRAAANMPNP